MSLREDLCVFVPFIGGKIVVIISLYVRDLLLGLDTVEREAWFIEIILAGFTVTVIGLPTNNVGRLYRDIFTFTMLKLLMLSL